MRKWKTLVQEETAGERTYDEHFADNMKVWAAPVIDV